jgi:GNAT superfamily N-acetyltransferase
VAAVRVEVVAEESIAPAVRDALGALMPERWLQTDDERRRAWTKQQPQVRAIAYDAGPIGQAAICLLRPAGPRVAGIGDVVVAVDHRRAGIGTTLLREAVRAAEDLGAETIVAASRHHTVRRVLEELGFRPCNPHELVFRRGDYVAWNETWIVRGEPGDLVEIVGDV